MKRFGWWILGGLMLIALLFGGAIANYALDTRVKVSFLDVGQGDAILISQGNNQVLVDGGRDGTLLLSRLGRALPFWDRTIETVIMTHPDDDHIGGLAALAGRYQVGQWLMTGAAADTEAWRRLDALAVPRVPAVVGTAIKLSDQTTMDILWTYVDTPFDPQDTNRTSVVTRLSVAGHTFLLTGDLPAAEEWELYPGRAEVLKVGHHGSKYSTSDVFLSEVRPREAIISVGAGNRYGHPAPDILNRLDQHGIAVYRTDHDGTVTYRCPETADPCTVATES